MGGSARRLTGVGLMSHRDVLCFPYNDDKHLSVSFRWLFSMAAAFSRMGGRNQYCCLFIARLSLPEAINKPEFMRRVS